MGFGAGRAERVAQNLVPNPLFADGTAVRPDDGAVDHLQRIERASIRQNKARVTQDCLFPALAEGPGAMRFKDRAATAAGFSLPSRMDLSGRSRVRAERNKPSPLSVATARPLKRFSAAPPPAALIPPPAGSHTKHLLKP